MSIPEDGAAVEPKKRKSGIPTGHAGEYFVMGELLKQGFDAQLADRNTKGYDLLAGRSPKPMQRIQVKTVRSQPWYVRTPDFTVDLLDQVTIYVLLGPERSKKPVRYFIAKNRDLNGHFTQPSSFQKTAFMSLKAVQQYEDRWDILEQIP
jgi:hypothetical protein